MYEYNSRKTETAGTALPRPTQNLIIQRKCCAVSKTPCFRISPSRMESASEISPHLEGKEICVPSSGDNHAAFAFALMGAHVTSCDISEKQLENARKAAETLGFHSIEFVRADTMTLDPFLTINMILYTPLMVFMCG